tara:strand:+ start:116362 stop:117009 length:648 start_codon:yes stop_codon:yes gene_type:complete
MDEVTLQTVSKAAYWAIKHHDGQWRKGGDGPPYVTHCARVAETAARMLGDSSPRQMNGRHAIQCVAWLHDIVEDTAVTIEEIRAEFGNTIAESVEALTLNDEEQRNWELKLKSQIEAVQSASHISVPMVKLADKHCNVIDLVTMPPPNWSPEKVLGYANSSLQVAMECYKSLLETTIWGVFSINPEEIEAVLEEMKAAHKALAISLVKHVAEGVA